MSFKVKILVLRTFISGCYGEPTLMFSLRVDHDIFDGLNSGKGSKVNEATAA